MRYLIIFFSLIKNVHCWQVCELHFQRKEILREAEVFDAQNGLKLIANLERPRLSENAIPCIFPNCPAYLSTQKNQRESPSSKRDRIESDQVKQTIAESIETSAEYNKMHCFYSFEDLLNVIQKIDLPASWIQTKNERSLNFLKIKLSPDPLVSVSVCIDKDLKLTCFVERVEIKKLGNFNFPFIISNVNDINDKLCEISNLEPDAVNVKESDFYNLINDVLSLLINTSDDKKKKL